MKIVVLLSAGISPISGRPAPVPTELRAIGLAVQILAERGGTVMGLHVGPASSVLRDYAGYGLSEITCLEGAGDAVVEAVSAWMRSGAADSVDLVLTGRRGMGGTDSGMVPYQFAEDLGWPVVGDVTAVRVGSDGRLGVEQGRPRGVRRPVSVSAPCVLAVHENALSLPHYVYARTRAPDVRIVSVSDICIQNNDVYEDRPYRSRPKMITASGPSRDGKVLLAPEPEDAAREIIAHLRALGVLKA